MGDTPATQLAESDNVRIINPSIKVPLFKLVALLSVLSVFSIVAVGLSQGMFSVDTESNRILLGVSITMVILVLMGIFNVLARIYILRKTTYILGEDRLYKKFQLFYRKSEREIPIGRLRGVELTQSALQNIFNFGTLVFLTAGPNRSLGFLEFSNIPDPQNHREEIRRLMDEESKSEP